MSENEITVHTPDGMMPVFTVHPDHGGPFPVAILYMDGVGYREQIKENARRFAAGGFYVAAPDLFYRAGPGLSFDMEKIRAEGMSGPAGEELMKVIATVKPEGVVADTRAVFDAIASDPAAAADAPKVCVGYCMGARMAVHVASALADEFVAAAAIHPGALFTDKPDSPHHDLAAVRGELYVAFAEVDRTATPESVDQFRMEMERRSVRGVVERLPAVTHGFAMADLSMYDRDAAERHFERTLDLWRRNVEQPVRA
jgi:carboxymethylenebutenolidase